MNSRQKIWSGSKRIRTGPKGPNRRAAADDPLVPVAVAKGITPEVSPKSPPMQRPTGSSRKSSASWSEVKAKLAQFDRAGLLGLLHDLYAASNDNQAFLHARFALGGDVLIPYKATIDRWLWPDMFKNQDISVTKAKTAIADFKKANGRSDGLAELMVFYCERAAAFARDVGLQDEGYFNALVRMFERALNVIESLPEVGRPALVARLDSVRRQSHHLGYGVGDELDERFARYGIDGVAP